MHQTAFTPPAAQTPDMMAIKARQQATWRAGDYGQIGVRLQSVGESLCDAVHLHATDKVLDVAAGNGNASLAAARHFADVTSTDYVPELLDQGRRRAEAERLTIRFQTADAEDLPFPDGSFDVVLSTFGVMFAPDHERAASQLLRVTRPGGRIGLTNWTPDSFIGQLFRVLSAHVAPPAGLRSPLEWGSEAHLTKLFGAAARNLRIEQKAYTFRYRSAEHWIEVFRSYYGPTHKAFAALDEAGQQQLHAALLGLLARFDHGDNGGGLCVPSAYIEVVVTKA